MIEFQLVAGLGLLAAVYCGAQAWRNFARGDMVWAIAGLIALLCIVAILLIPIPTHAVKYDLVG